MNKNQKDWLLLAAAAGGAAIAARAVARRVSRYDFRRKNVLITGGSRGLGLLLGRRLADEGANLAICARDENQLEAARRDLAKRGVRVFAAACDVTDRAQVEKWVAESRRRLGAVDVLINNAGLIQVGPMAAMTLEDYDKAMKAHFWAPLYATLAVLPSMRGDGRGGRIVNISSIGGKIAVPHLLPYSASKFALVGLSAGLRAELAKDDIVVTTVCPGLMRTGSPRNATIKGRHRAEYAWFSIGDSLPLTSMSAERAASQIVEACRRGDAEVVLSVQAQLAVAFHSVFPGLTADLMGLVDRFLLPSSEGVGRDSRRGYQSESSWSPSALTALGDRAAVRNNEI